MLKIDALVFGINGSLMARTVVASYDNLSGQGKKKTKHNFSPRCPSPQKNVGFRVPQEVVGRHMKKSELHAIMKEEVTHEHTPFSSLPEGIMPL